MASTSLVPGADIPIRPPREAQIRALQARVSASEAVVNLLCALAYGERGDGWPPNLFGPTASAAMRQHQAMIEVTAHA